MTSKLDSVIFPSPEGTPFWEALKLGRLVIPRCTACGEFFFYPRTLCPVCGSRDVGWVEASGRGELHSYCVINNSMVPGLIYAVPFATGLVDLAEGPRVMAFLRGFPDDPEQIRCGTPVRVDFVEVRDGDVMLAFQPVDPVEAV